jgi:hypothetical protein
MPVKSVIGSFHFSALMRHRLDLLVAVKGLGRSSALLVDIAFEQTPSSNLRKRRRPGVWGALPDVESLQEPIEKIYRVEKI